MEKIEDKELRSFEEILFVDKHVHIDGITDDIVFNFSDTRLINRRMKPFFGNNKSYKFTRTNEMNKYTHTMSGYFYHELWFKSKFDFDLVEPDLFEI